MEITLAPLQRQDTLEIVRYNRDQDEKFLMQWAGGVYKYPITPSQINARLEACRARGGQIYRIQLDGKMIGTIETAIIDPKERVARIARFIINPRMRKRGFGTIALRQLSNELLSRPDIDAVRLAVFDFNVNALRMYQKMGFTAIHNFILPNGWVTIEMELRATVV